MRRVGWSVAALCLLCVGWIYVVQWTLHGGAVPRPALVVGLSSLGFWLLVLWLVRSVGV